MRMIARPDAASSEMIRWTSTLAPMSMPRVGSSRIRTRGSVASHLPSTTFCWLPPESACTDWSTPVVRIWSCIHVPAAESPFRRRPDEQPREQPRQDRQRDVGGDREVEDEAVLVAVLGDVGDAGRHRRGRRRERDRLAGQRDRRPRSAPVDPEQDARDLGPPGTDQARQTEDLARPHREADVVEGLAPGQALDLEEHVADRRLDLREQRHRAADHVADEVGGRQLGGRAP